MGWMRTLMLGDIGNRLDIADNESRIQAIGSRQRRHRLEKRQKDRSQDAKIASLESEVEELQLTVAVMTSVLLSKGVFDVAEFNRALSASETGGEESASGAEQG